MRFILSILVVTLLVKNTSAQIISTVAGNGTYGFSGDGGSATAAMLAHPEGVAIDSDGNLYICDNKCVRKVSPASGGTITTFAGVGTSAGYSGDGGPAYFARVNGVHDVAVDKFGNVFLADAGNNRVRKVTLDGVINTIAGTGVPGYNGDGIAATAAQLNSPYGVVVDDTGNIYIADCYNYRIRKVDTSGIISTIVGTGISGYNGDGGMANAAQIHHPLSLDIDGLGNLVFTDSGRIRKIDLSGTISTIAGNGIPGYSGDGGSATAAQISPVAVAIDDLGNLFCAEFSANRIRKVSSDGTINTIAGTGFQNYNGDGVPPIFANLWWPSGVALNFFGDIFVGDAGNCRIRVIKDSTDGVGITRTETAEIRMFPNPSNGKCRIMVVGIEGRHVQLEVSNMNGIEVLRQKIPVNKEITISTPWPPGCYIVIADVDGQQITSKLTVR